MMLMDFPYKTIKACVRLLNFIEEYGEYGDYPMHAWMK